MLNNIFHGASDELKKTVGLEPVEGYEPCEEDYMTAWVNQESVKEALHVKSSIEWEQCSRSIRYSTLHCIMAALCWCAHPSCRVALPCVP